MTSGASTAASGVGPYGNGPRADPGDHGSVARRLPAQTVLAGRPPAQAVIAGRAHMARGRRHLGTRRRERTARFRDPRIHKHPCERSHHLWSAVSGKRSEFAGNLEGHTCPLFIV